MNLKRFVDVDLGNLQWMLIGMCCFAKDPVLLYVSLAAIGLGIGRIIIAYRLK